MCSNCCCTKLETIERRNIFTAEELRIVKAINEEFLRCLGRLPTVKERRFWEEVIQMSGLFKDGTLY